MATINVIFSSSSASLLLCLLYPRRCWPGDLKFCEGTLVAKIVRFQQQKIVWKFICIIFTYFILYIFVIAHSSRHYSVLVKNNPIQLIYNTFHLNRKFNWRFLQIYFLKITNLFPSLDLHVLWSFMKARLTRIIKV